MKTALATVLLILAAPLAARAEDVLVRTSDGRRLHAVLHPAGAAVGRAAIVCVHGFLASHEVFERSVEEFTSRGITVLSIDLRGHGANAERADDRQAVLDRDPKVFGSMKEDVLAAVRYLADRGHDTSRIGLLGVSLGASLALQAAAEEPALPCLALLSPHAAYPGLDPLGAARKLGDRAVLLVSSEEDAKEGVKPIAAAIPGDRVEMRRIAEHKLHGIALLDRVENLTAEVATWFARHLSAEVVLDGTLSEAETNRAEVHSFGETGKLLVRHFPDHVWLGARGEGASALLLTVGDREYRFDAKGVTRTGAGGALPLPAGSVRAVGKDAVEILLPVGGFGLARGTESRLAVRLRTAEGLSAPATEVSLYFPKPAPRRRD